MASTRYAASSRGAEPVTKLRVAIVATLALLSLVAAAAQDRDIVLRAEFPVDLQVPPSAAAFQGVVDPLFVARVPDGEALAALQAEARWTFAGMIWGFDYIYTPSDRARAIQELFDIRQRSPVAAQVLPLKAVSARLDGTVLFGTVECYPDAVQRRELASWKASSAVEQGSGSAKALQGGSAANAAAAAVEARREATVVAVREALRAFLRELTHNKPREVRGSFALASVPRLFIRDGQWIASVRIYARVDEIISYGAY